TDLGSNKATQRCPYQPALFNASLVQNRQQPVGTMGDTKRRNIAFTSKAVARQVYGYTAIPRLGEWLEVVAPTVGPCPQAMDEDEGRALAYLQYSCLDAMGGARVLDHFIPCGKSAVVHRFSFNPGLNLDCGGAVTDGSGATGSAFLLAAMRRVPGNQVAFD